MDTFFEAETGETRKGTKEFDFGCFKHTISIVLDTMDTMDTMDTLS